MAQIKMRCLFACVAVLMLVMALLTSPLAVFAKIVWMQLRLSAPMPDFGNVFTYLITPDGNYVIYAADRSQDEYLNLFRVSPDGGQPVQLDQFPTLQLAATTASTQGRLSPSIICCDPPPPQAGTRLMGISPDSQWVLFDLNRIQYSVSVQGGTPIELAGPIGFADGPPHVFVTPDSHYAVFAGNAGTGSPEQLISVPIEGGPAHTLGVSPITNLTYYRVEIAPDSQNVIFWAGASTVELYSVPITGGIPLKLNAPLVTDGTVDSLGNSTISSDGRTVVYRADQETDEVWELYSVSIDGGPTTKLNAPLVNNGDTTVFQMSPDGQHVVYLADQETDEDWKLYSVAVSGSVPVELPPLITENVEVFLDFRITPDSRRVIYLASSTVTGSRVALYSIAIEDGTPLALSAPMPTTGFIDTWLLSPDGEHVAYTVRTEGSEHIDLFVASVSDGTRVKIDLSPTNHNIDRYRFTHDSEYLIFPAFTMPEGMGLFRVSANGGTVDRIDSPLHRLNITQSDFASVPGSSTVIYGTNEATTGQLELFRTFEANLTNKLLLPSARR